MTAGIRTVLRSGRRSPRRAARFVTVLGIVLVVGALVAACDSGLPTPSASPSLAPVATPTVTVYPLGTTIWYAGLELTFTQATAEIGQYGGNVTVPTSFENPTSIDQQLVAPIQLVVGGKRIDVEHGTELPTVPAGGTSDLTLTFDVVGSSTVDGAAIEVGGGDTNQAIVPLRSGGSLAAVTLEPQALAVTGTANAADLRVVVRSGELRWDLPDWADELARGRAVITVWYDATYRGTFSGGLAFTADAVRLTIPDGSTVAPRRDGHSQSVVLLLPGTTQAGLSSRFEIPSGETGAYVLTIRNGSARATVRFTISR